MRSSLIVGEINNERGVDDLIGRRGLSFGRYLIWVWRVVRKELRGESIKVFIGKSRSWAEDERKLVVSISVQKWSGGSAVSAQRLKGEIVRNAPILICKAEA